MSTAPTVDVHAHVLLPEVEAPVAGLPGHTKAKALDARRNGPAALAVSGPLVCASRNRPTPQCGWPRWTPRAWTCNRSAPRPPTTTTTRVLRELVRVAGADRVLLGSDFPFDMGTEDPVTALRAARLPEPDFHAVRGGNASAFLFREWTSCACSPTCGTST